MNADLRQLLAEVFETTPDKIRETDSQATLPMWDSLRHLQLVMALEQRFGIQIDTEQIAQLKTVADIARVVAAGRR